MSIKLPKSCKPEEVAAKEGSRYAITDPWFDQGMKAVCATDGRMVVIIPVESDGEETGALPREALKAFRKAVPRGVEDMAITADNGTVSCHGITMPREAGEGRRYPEVGGVVPAKAEPPKAREGVETITSICLDAKLLAKLAKAMGSDTVRLQITDSGAAIRVDPIEVGYGSYGAIMPLGDGS